MSKEMDGSRVRNLLNAEISALLASYTEFEKLVPHDTQKGSAHPAEDGHSVEVWLRAYLRKYLPRNLEVSTGFILRPAVKTGKTGSERRGQKDAASSQLDIIIHDSANYPVFRRCGEDVVVPPEGVVAIISVKKRLILSDITKELSTLRDVSMRCRCLGLSAQIIRKPFLALVGMDSGVREKNKVWEKIQQAYFNADDLCFEDLVGCVMAVGNFSAFKARPDNAPPEARYVWHNQSAEERKHLGLQFLLTGVLSVYYDETRNVRRRPGFTGFSSDDGGEFMGTIKVHGLR